MLTGRPLFPGKNVVHQLDLMTDFLGTPSAETIARIRNEKARRYLSSMWRKQPVPFSQKFPNVDPLALHLLEHLLAFDQKDRPTVEEALADPYFWGLANIDREPSTQPISKLEFEFERRKLTKDDVRGLIYREILEYHPLMLQEYLQVELIGLSANLLILKSITTRVKEVLLSSNNMHLCLEDCRICCQPEKTLTMEDGSDKPNTTAPSLLKSASISASKRVDVKGKLDIEEEPIPEHTDECVDGLSLKVRELCAAMNAN